MTGIHTVEGRDVKLALARGIAPGNGAATVDYTPPATDAVRDLVGNTAGAFEDQSVNVTAVPNNVASGTVTIAVQGSGTATVGQTVQGTVSDGVEDPDGLENPTYTYQWVRVDGSNETDIAGATAASYTLTASDAGKKLKLKASFRDILNNGETLTSAVWPTSTRITWAAEANCGRTFRNHERNARADLDWTGHGRNPEPQRHSGRVRVQHNQQLHGEPVGHHVRTWRECLHHRANRRRPHSRAS